MYCYTIIHLYVLISNVATRVRTMESKVKW